MLFAHVSGTNKQKKNENVITAKNWIAPFKKKKYVCAC